MMTRLFSFTGEDNLPHVGVEWRGAEYDFTRSWEIYKQLKLNGQGPAFPFLQLVIEMDLLHKETFDELFEALKEVRPLDDLKLRGHRKMLPPIARPGKIIGIGRNYADHAKELGNAIPDEPVFFAKAPSSLVAVGDRIRLPAGAGRVDFEGELGIVVGKECSQLSEEEAAEAICGYTIVNDITARALQKKAKEKGLPWFQSKSFDTFCPMGPYLVPSGCIKDVSALEIITRLNGEVKQSATAADMLFAPATLLSYVSRQMTLHPGDIIATGTPAGVGAIGAGDTIEVEISELGVLRNRVA